MKNISWIRNPYIAVGGFVLSVVVNLPHMVAVYQAAAAKPLPAIVTYIGFAVLELGILILAVNGDKVAAKAFSWLVFLVNLSFYLSKDSIQWVIDWPLFQPVGIAFLLSSIPAFMIYYFSDLFAGYVDRDNWRAEKEQAAEDIRNARNESGRLRNKLEAARKGLESLRNDLEDQRKEAEAARNDVKETRKSLELIGNPDGINGKALEVLAHEWNLTGKSKDNYRKQIKGLQTKLSKNGISGEAKDRLILRIAIMERERQKAVH